MFKYKVLNHRHGTYPWPVVAFDLSRNQALKWLNGYKVRPQCKHRTTAYHLRRAEDKLRARIIATDTQAMFI